ncbi:hypothetical protein [Flavobacterium lindanitolerans]|uniref:hypothetical protein n=1 Tax=Flavobacterium lindanitolerans TaxID=428988 RepID=UPI0027B97310|nr:hypothetical protein [Flavobacterium lindanitolerans]
MKPKKSSLHRVFPNTNVAAYYDPLSQIITLSKYNAADFKELDLATFDSKNIEKRVLFEHEFTHWLDHVSTLWGQKSIASIYNALNARAIGKIEEFWRMKSLFTNFGSDNFFHYFTEEYEHPENPKTPWRYQITSGIRFSHTGMPEYNKPILFLRFNCADNLPLIRVPLSVASILESNAIYAEFFLKIMMTKSIEDAVERNLKLKKIQEEWLSILYDKDFALYTVIAHLTSNLNNQSEVSFTYEISAGIGTIILNLPDEIFAKMETVKIKIDEWDRRIKEFQNINDKGFGYYNLLKNYIDKGGQNKYSLEDILSSSNLPQKEKLEEIIIEEMQANKHLLIDGPFKEMAITLIDKGIEIFKIRGIDGKNKDFRQKLLDSDFFPKLIFGDTIFDDTNFNISTILKKLNSGEKLSLEEHYLCFDFYDSKFNEFINACGI